MIGKMGSFYDWDAQRSYSPAEMLALVERRRGTLKSLGISSGSRVLLPAYSGAEFFASLLALWSLEACAIPLDPRLTEAESQAVQSKSAAGFVLARGIEDFGPALPLTDWPAPNDREALILFTTGTLSAPRGVVLSSRAIENKISALGRVLPLDDMQSTLCFLPVSFGHGLIANSLGPWLNGCELTSAPPLDVASAQGLSEMLQTRNITSFSSVPGVWALLSRMMETSTRAKVRRLFCASAPLGENTWRIIQKLFPDVPVHNVYGLTEMASWVSVSAPIGEFAPGRIGEPFDGEMRIENGEIYVRGKSRMTGYLGEPPLSKGDWFKTEDVATFEPRVGYTLRGRAGHVVNKGGVKVQLEEIDSILSSHGLVKDALGFKIEDKDLGENFEVAVVLLRDSQEARAQLQTWFSSQVNPQRRPARWHFLEALPVNARGKPDRTELKRRVGR